MLQYSTVNYQGIEFGANYDLSSFEYMHVDVWTASPEFENLEISLISPSNGEKTVLGKLDQDKWTSLDIPLREWTKQGLTIGYFSTKVGYKSLESEWSWNYILR